MSVVVCGIRPSINSAFKKVAPSLGVTRKAVYDKIDRVETTTSDPLVRHSASVLGEIIDELGCRNEPWLQGYRVRNPRWKSLAGMSTGSSRSASLEPGLCRSLSGGA